MKNKQGKVFRQSISNRLVHWLTVISIFSLIISGFGQMPMYKRYNIVKLPNAEWLGDYSITLVMHYLGAIALIFIIFYHMFVHLLMKEFDIIPKRGDIKESLKNVKASLSKGESQPSEKYLTKQRLAYAAFGVAILALIISGLIKIAKNISLITLSEQIIFWATMIHNIATMMLIFLIIAHLSAFLIKANRKLIPGMLTGYIDEEYAQHKHSLWYKKITQPKTPQHVKAPGDSPPAR